MSVWVFVLILNLPSFGGEVVATVTAQTYEACDRLRTLVMRQFGGEHNIKGSVTRCTIAVSDLSE